MINEDIFEYARQKVLECIEFGVTELGVFLLILHVDLDFSKKITTGYVITKLLEYNIVLSLGYILHLKKTENKDWFYETHKRTNNFSGTEPFYGDWKDHLRALIFHEMAHVFERMSRIEPHSRSKINEYYDLRTPNKGTQHHNHLWRLIYRDLRSLKNTESSCKPIVIRNESGFNFFYQQEKI